MLLSAIKSDTMKVFISQSMRGLAEREIKLNRLKAIENIKRLYGNDVEIIDSYFDGNGWNKAHGCKIEYMCASDYDIKIIFEEGD